MILTVFDYIRWKETHAFLADFPKSYSNKQIDEFVTQKLKEYEALLEQPERTLEEIKCFHKNTQREYDRLCTVEDVCRRISRFGLRKGETIDRKDALAFNKLYSYYKYLTKKLENLVFHKEHKSFIKSTERQIKTIKKCLCKYKRKIKHAQLAYVASVVEQVFKIADDPHMLFIAENLFDFDDETSVKLAIDRFKSGDMKCNEAFDNFFKNQAVGKTTPQNYLPF